jgi:hypothetical protein
VSETRVLNKRLIGPPRIQFPERTWHYFALVFRGTLPGFEALRTTLNSLLEGNNQIKLSYQKISLLPLTVLAARRDGMIFKFKESQRFEPNNNINRE